MITADAGPKPKPKVRRFGSAREAERFYMRRLREIAKHIGAIIRGFPVGDPASLGPIVEALHAYSRTLAPWAKSVAARMLDDVNRADTAAWASLARQMSRSLAREIADAPTGAVMQQLLASQVELITSLPIDAAQRVHNLTMEAMVDGTRADTVAAEILRSGEVSASRAMLIARTEISRTATSLTQARAQHIGSDGYIWRSSRDASVRPSPVDMKPAEFARLNTLARGSHRKLDGTFHRWDDPPIAGEHGERAHPGCIYNCRCWPEVVLPQDLR